MPYVMVTADPDWAFGGDTVGLRLLEQWAHRLDELDGSITFRHRPGSGGRMRHVSVPEVGFSSNEELLSDPDVWNLVCRPFVEAITSACSMARSGRLGLAYGHGSTEREAWVDLAPRGILRVDMGFLRAYRRQKAAGLHPPRGPTLEERLFEVLGSVVREHHFVRGIDLYTCSIGATDEGRQVLNAIHYFWRVPLRGLRGVLWVTGIPRHPADVPSVRVLAPPGPVPRGRGFGRVFVDRLIDDPSLWARSHRAAPPL